MCCLLGFLSSCGKLAPVTPKPVIETSDVVSPETSPALSLPSREGNVNPVDVPAWDTDPMSAWVVANSLAEFHATWTEYCAQSAAGPIAPDSLVPYADALTHNGESWGLSTSVPELILLDTEGYAYRYPEGRHGIAPAKEKRFPLDTATLQKLDWSTLESGQELHTRNAGSTLHVLGALRAVGVCQECHQMPENTLLGAYHYALHEIADD